MDVNFDYQSEDSCYLSLYSIDQTCDYVPVLSTLTNVINLLAKAILYCCSCCVDLGDHCFSYIEDKSLLRCLALLIPVLGNIVVGIYDCCVSYQNLSGLPEEPRNIIVPNNPLAGVVFDFSPAQGSDQPAGGSTTPHSTQTTSPLVPSDSTGMATIVPTPPSAGVLNNPSLPAGSPPQGSGQPAKDSSISHSTQTTSPTVPSDSTSMTTTVSSPPSKTELESLSWHYKPFDGSDAPTQYDHGWFNKHRENAFIYVLDIRNDREVLTKKENSEVCLSEQTELIPARLNPVYNDRFVKLTTGLKGVLPEKIEISLCDNYLVFYGSSEVVSPCYYTVGCDKVNPDGSIHYGLSEEGVKKEINSLKGDGIAPEQVIHFPWRQESWKDLTRDQMENKLQSAEIEYFKGFLILTIPIH